jgi:hypothetical protein
VVDGSAVRSVTHQTEALSFEVCEINGEYEFQIMKSMPYDVILGLDWLKKYNQQMKEL